ncbi:MAG TPA: hypothetical protein VF075_16125, partial [Pyrinomonadaceae bacterium]
MSVATRIVRRRRRRPSVNSAVFEEEFALESLKSDRLRVTILIGAIFSALASLGILIPLFFDEFQAAFHGNFGRFLIAVFIVFGLNLGYLITERIIIDRLIAKEIHPFGALKFLSAFVETSIPTAGMIIGSFFLGPIYTLFTPAAFLYPIFISLSALRLNVRLCIFTGTVAAVEYSLLAMYLIQKAAGTSVEP